jgi:hypothetical protein
MEAVDEEVGHPPKKAKHEHDLADAGSFGMRRIGKDDPVEKEQRDWQQGGTER